MKEPELSIAERAGRVYRDAYNSVMPANWNRAQRRTAQGRALQAEAEAKAQRARADYLEEELGIRENCKVVVEAVPVSSGFEISDTRIDNESFDDSIPAFDDPRNWVEDYPHDNGQYMNRCLSCRRIFIGYKRRITCKLCASTQPKQLELGI